MSDVVWEGLVAGSDGNDHAYEVASAGVKDGKHQDLVVYRLLAGRRVAAVSDSEAYSVLVAAICDLVPADLAGKQ